MPNHISNFLTINDVSEERVNEILDAIAVSKPDNWEYGDSQLNTETDQSKWGRGTIDFNGLVPEPDYAEDEAGPNHNPNWYKWRRDNWGNKWNAYGCSLLEPNRIFFLTAWSNVLGLMVKLSEDFPDASFKYEYFDEDFGAQVGSVTLKAGNKLNTTFPEDFSKEAYDLIFQMSDGTAEYYGMRYDETVNTYVYVDDGVVNTYVYADDGKLAE